MPWLLNCLDCIYVFYEQNITEETQVVVSEIVAEITSEPENLTAADVSASASILTNLTEGATKHPKVTISFILSDSLST